MWRTCIIKTLIIQDKTIEILDNLLTHLTSLESKPLVRGCIRKRSYVAKLTERILPHDYLPSLSRRIVQETTECSEKMAYKLRSSSLFGKLER